MQKDKECLMVGGLDGRYRIEANALAIEAVRRVPQPGGEVGEYCGSRLGIG